MKTIKVTDLDKVKELIASTASSTAKYNFLQYCDIRVEASEGIGSVREDGNPKITSKDFSLSLGVRAIAGESMLASGFYGRQLGVNDLKNFAKVLQDATTIAYEK